MAVITGFLEVLTVYTGDKMLVRDVDSVSVEVEPPSNKSVFRVILIKQSTLSSPSWERSTHPCMSNAKPRLADKLNGIALECNTDFLVATTLQPFTSWFYQLKPRMNMLSIFTLALIIRVAGVWRHQPRLSDQHHFRACTEISLHAISVVEPSIRQI
jgi:hypothetical protein